MIEALVAVVGIGMVLLVLAAVGANGIIAKNQAKTADALGILKERFGECDYHTVLPGPRCIGMAWGQEALILGDTVADAIAIPLSDVRSADIELDGVSVTNSKNVTTSNRGSQLAGGLVGGVLLGPVGLVVGGLSGSSTSNGKAVETRKIKSVKLVIRVADRAKPLRTFIFFDIGYGEGYEATSPIVAPAIKKAGHFHALLQQVIEDRERSSPAVAGAAFASNPTTAIIAAMGLLLAGAAFPIRADAYDLGKALAGTAETKLASAKPLDQVERCIFISDLAAPPIAYRSPDGTRSLIHGGRSQPIFVFELLRSPTGTDVIVWQGKGYVDKIQPCL